MIPWTDEPAPREDVLLRWLDDDPHDGRLWLLLGHARRSAGDWPGARAAYESAAVLVPLGPVGRAALAECYLRAGDREAARTEYLFLAGHELTPDALLPPVAGGLVAVGDYGVAEDVWEEVARAYPRCAAAWYGIAACRWHLDAPPSLLIGPLTAAVDLAPGVAAYRLTLANVWSELGRYADAAEALSGVDVMALGCPACVGRVRAVFERAGDRRRAAAAARRLRELGGGEVVTDGDD